MRRLSIEFWGGHLGARRGRAVILTAVAACAAGACTGVIHGNATGAAGSSGTRPVVALTGGSSGGGTASQGTGDGGGGTTVAPTAFVGRGLRRLSQREYNNVVRDLLGDTTQPADRFTSEVYTNGYDNGADSLIVQSVDDFQIAGEALAATAVASNLTSLIGSCNPTPDGQTCVDAFVTGFVTKAYRRPATDAERQRLQKVYTAGTAGGAGFKGGLQLMVEAVLQSPSFLYRSELGAPDPSMPTDVVRLTDYEVASELSFLLTGTTPDAALLSAAQSGALKTPDQIREQAVRLLAASGTPPTFRAFYHQWMNTQYLSGLTKDPVYYPALSNSPDLGQSLAGELDRLFDQILWKGTGSLRELLTTTQGFVDSNLAKLVYGVSAPATGFQAVQLDAKIRRGLLTRAGILAANADEDNSGPVARGVFVMGSLLCSPPPPPPANVPSQPPISQAVNAHQTTRQRLDVHLNYDFCKSCHTEIDGIGFGFEQFDALGVYRTTENGQPVDTSGNLTVGDVPGPFTGVAALEDKLLQSQDVLSCMTKQVYRYAMGQLESDGANGVLAVMQNGFTADSHAKDAFLALMTAPDFVLRATAQTTP
jgi:hypothetical protein